VAVLPGIRLDLFVALLDRLRHGLEIRPIDGTYEAHEVPAWRSGRRRQSPREIQYLTALGIIQAVHLLDDLLPESSALAESKSREDSPRCPDYWLRADASKKRFTGGADLSLQVCTSLRNKV
jgi:hypothetical protein